MSFVGRRFFIDGFAFAFWQRRLGDLMMEVGNDNLDLDPNMNFYLYILLLLFSSDARTKRKYGDLYNLALVL